MRIAVSIFLFCISHQAFGVATNFNSTGTATTGTTATSRTGAGESISTNATSTGGRTSGGGGTTSSATGTASAATTTVSNSSATEVKSVTNNPTNITPAAGGGGSAKGAADMAKMVGYATAAVSAGIGAYMISTCSSNMMNCAMGAMMIANAAQQLAGAGSAGKTSDALTPNGFGSATFDPGADAYDCSKPQNQGMAWCSNSLTATGTGLSSTGSAVGSTTSATNRGGTVTGGDPSGTTVTGPGGMTFSNNPNDILARIAQSKAVLAKSGIKLSSDGKSIQLPNGQTGPVENFISPEKGAQLRKLTEDLTQRQIAGLSSSTVSVPNNGGNGYGPNSGAGSSESGFDFKMPTFNHASARAPAGDPLAGMSRPFGEEKIGIAEDDIFRMINRTYNRLDKEGAFLP